MQTNKRPETMARINTQELAEAFIAEQVKAVQEQVGDKKVLLALSGGVDSSVVAALLIKAVGKQLVCVHVNHGLLRKGEPEQVVEVFRNQMDANLIYVDAVDRFLDKLAGVSDPEQKRKIIGAEFIRVFEEEARHAAGFPSKIGDHSLICSGLGIASNPTALRTPCAPCKRRRVAFAHSACAEEGVPCETPGSACSS